MADAAPTPWFDETSETPLLAEHARKLTSFIEAVADGRIDIAELESQEKRLIALMKQVEPLLAPEAHEKVSQLLCEVTAYGMMNTLYMASHSRSKVTFRG